MAAPRKLAFVLAATEQGTMIVNRLDRHAYDAERGIGVGYQLLETGAYDPSEVEVALRLLDIRRRTAGDGVVALDCGANIGVHAVSWARAMTGWGQVVAIEAQERIFYALAGNAALANCFNLRVIHAAVAAADGTMAMPAPDYTRAGSFGSLSLRGDGAEYIGQAVSYAEADSVPVRALAIDSLALPRLDLLKIDVEGMEVEAIEGGRASVARHRPLVLVEHVKSGEARLRALLGEFGYVSHALGMNLLGIHPDDPAAQFIAVKA